MYNFFAYLSRMKYIERWSLMRSSCKENIMEHSEQVAQIAGALAKINNRVFGGNADSGRATEIAVFHETSEVLTGDLPTPIKYYNVEINKAYKDIEKIANDQLLETLPDVLREDYYDVINPDKNSIEYKLVKGADKISAYVKCLEEIASGNNDFSQAEKAIKLEIEKLNLPEVHYFMEHFVKGFTLTLDELAGK